MSRIVAMIYNTTRANQWECKTPREFNTLARWLDGEDGEPGADEERDDFAWIEEEERKKRAALNGEQAKH